MGMQIEVIGPATIHIKALKLYLAYMFSSKPLLKRLVAIRYGLLQLVKCTAYPIC